MTTLLERQAAYWHREAESFDRIYSHRKPAISNLLDRIFRKDMYERFAFTMTAASPVEGRTVLDVGCGSGKYVVELARRGAAHIDGLDIAPRMLDLCRIAAREAGVADRCRFVHTDLLQFTPDRAYDVTLGIGLFDYIRDPLPVLRKMCEVTTGRAVLSFPRLWTWRAPIRRMRLALRGCSVYFYTRSRIERLLHEAGFRRYTMRRVGKLFCVVAER